MERFRVFSLPGVAAALLLVAGASDEAGRGDGDALLLGIADRSFDGPVAASVEKVVDGDTLDVRAAIWLGQTVDVRIRIAGIDAPELQARCPEERQRALAARAFLEERLGHGAVRLSNIVYDKYGGRMLASVADADGDIADAMLMAGLARPYDGGKRGSWCASKNAD